MTHQQNFRPFLPTDGPYWLPRFSESIVALFRRMMPGPFRLHDYAAADLPAAAENPQALAYDSTQSNIAFSNGSGWKYWSFSDHVHAASAITFSPAGNVAATDVQAAIEELDGEKAPAVHGHAISDVTGLEAALDAKLDDGQASAFGLSLLDDSDAAAARSTLGLGTIATQNANDVALTGGSITGLTAFSTAAGTYTIGGVGAVGSTSLVVKGFVGSLVLQDGNTPGPTSTQAISLRDADMVERVSIEHGGSAGLAGFLRIINNGANGIQFYSGGGTLAMTITATAVTPVSATTASAANVHQASSGAALLRSTSARKYKTDILPLADAEADLLLQAEPITFRSLAEADDPDRRHWGFIADDVAAVLPILVNYDGQGQPDGFQYERVVVGLLSIVKRLEARVAALEGSGVAKGNGPL